MVEIAKLKLCTLFTAILKSKSFVVYLRKTTTFFKSQSIKIHERWSTCYLEHFLLKIPLNIYFTNRIANLKLVFTTILK